MQFQSKKAFSIVDVSGADSGQIRKLFYHTNLSSVQFERMDGKSYKKNCTVPREQLRYIRTLHYGFDGEVRIGEMVANKKIASKLCDIFYELYQEKYEIEKMVLVDDYDADDNLSMADNNTSCFNFRTVSGTKRLSNHSYGLAVDINPRYNPYIHMKDGKMVCEPENGRRYQNREKQFEHKITPEDPCYQIFIRNGFTWGGEWEASKDYQHFQY